MRQFVDLLPAVLWIVIGVSVFFWIGYEDRTTVAPVLLGGSLALALAIQVGQRFLMRSAATSRKRIVEYLLLGVFFGALAMPIAVLSILVKVSLHGHVPPDFSLVDTLAVLRRTPIWAGVGGLVGLAAVHSRRSGSEK